MADQALSDATKAAYRSDFSSFASWAADHDADHLPATADTVTLYLTHLYEIGRSVSTIARALTSISVAHKALGVPSPTTDLRLRSVLKGMRRKRGSAKRQARPIKSDLLKKMIDAIEPDAIGKRDRALLLIGWAGALRRSELVALDMADLDFVENGLIITIRHSKTDQEGEGAKIAIPAVDSAYCPVDALTKWISLSRIDSGPIFLSVGPGAVRKWFAPTNRRARLSARSVSLICKRRLEAVGVKPDQYSGHSLRAGFATSAAEIGTPERLIAEHTRHRSMQVLREYIREGNLFTDHPLPLLL